MTNTTTPVRRKQSGRRAGRPGVTAQPLAASRRRRGAVATLAAGWPPACGQLRGNAPERSARRCGVGGGAQPRRLRFRSVPPPVAPERAIRSAPRRAGPPPSPHEQRAAQEDGKQQEHERAACSTPPPRTLQRIARPRPPLAGERCSGFSAPSTSSTARCNHGLVWNSGGGSGRPAATA